MWPKILIAVLAFLAVASPAALAEFELAMASGYNTIDFGPMELGEEKTLARRGGYEHQFNFTSDKGRTWYFKAQLVRPFTSGAHTIPAENLQWVVEQIANGQGTVSASLSSPRPFSNSPVLIYTSTGTDESGTQVQLRLRYKLDIPQQQAAGAYTGHIRFIMMERL